MTVSFFLKKGTTRKSTPEEKETARKRVSRYQGQVMDALVEEINEHDPHLVNGRLSNNTIVHFPGSAELIGQIVPVYLKECRGFYYMGEMQE